ncbi:hypothetical protein P3S68_019750 [Capsicum galapagoense]
MSDHCSTTLESCSTTTKVVQQLGTVVLQLHLVVEQLGVIVRQLREVVQQLRKVVQTTNVVVPQLFQLFKRLVLFKDKFVEPTCSGPFWLIFILTIAKSFSHKSVLSTSFVYLFSSNSKEQFNFLSSTSPSKGIHLQKW